ncbi:hypothetical protein ACQ4LE_001643 [Meloidogyne hapla]
MERWEQIKIDKLKIGDLVACKMEASPFNVIHRGVYVGETNGRHEHTVVHNFCGEGGKKGAKGKKGGSNGGVIMWTLEEFRDSSINGYWWIDNMGRQAKFTGEEVARRARNRIGERNYKLMSWNCEHFATWCRFGEAYSPQAINGIIVASTVVGAIIPTIFGCNIN